MLAAAFLTHAPLIASAQGAEVVISDEARQHFRTGVALLDDPDGPRYEQAYRAFEAAYAASPSPKILGNLGLCAMMLERDGEAIAAYERYLADVADIAPEERAQIERDLEVLRASAFVLSVYAPRGTRIVDRRLPVQGPPVVNRYGPVGSAPLRLQARAGRHEVVLEHETKTERFSIEAKPGDHETLRLEIDSTGIAEGPPLAALLVLGATGTFALASFVTGGLALERQAAFEEANDGQEPEIAEAIRGEGVALNVTTDVLLVGAVMGAVATTALFLFLEEDEPTVSVAPTLGADGAGAWLELRF